MRKLSSNPFHQYLEFPIFCTGSPCVKEQRCEENSHCIVDIAGEFTTIHSIILHGRQQWKIQFVAHMQISCDHPLVAITDTERATVRDATATVDTALTVKVVQCDGNHACESRPVIAKPEPLEPHIMSKFIIIIISIITFRV